MGCSTKQSQKTGQVVGQGKYKPRPPLWKSVWQILRKLKIHLPQEQILLLLGLYPKDCKSYCRDTCSSVFMVIPLVVDKNWEQP